jgi:dethiobiotin synthetase
MRRIIVITGTDTGVGKTVLTALLASHLRAGGANAAALKPISSGARDDARALHRASGRVLTLDDTNPWHFRAALAPLLAARRERKRVMLREVVAQVHAVAHPFDTVLIEGAGGLLSPLGEDFSTRELIAALGAQVIVVAKNQVGVVNHVRLTLEALPPLTRGHARVVLMSPQHSSVASRTNPDLLKEFAHLFVLPWLHRAHQRHKLPLKPALHQILAVLLE